MKLENQVCSLEQAEKLFHLGVRYSSAQYAYVERLREKQLSNVSEFNRWAFQYDEPTVASREYFPAFTVAELGVMLPSLPNTYFSMPMKTDYSMWQCCEYRCDQDDPIGDGFIGNSEAEARAAVLISLIEKKITSVEEINQMLTISIK